MEIFNKVFFITGAAQGLGKAFAKAALEKGAKVFLGDIDGTLGEETLKELQHQFGACKVGFHEFDVVDKSAFEDTIKHAVSQFGHVDVFVNNAGFFHEGQWEKVIQVNLIGVINGTKLAEEYLRKDKGGKGGRIINISSVAGLADLAISPVYGATKHAVRSYTTAMARQVNRESQGIEYGVLCPDAVDTNMAKSVTESKVYMWEQFQNHVRTKTTQPERVAGALLHLVQLENMNGAILYIGKDKEEYKEMECKTVAAPV